MAVLATMLTGERFSSKQLQEEQCLHNAEIATNYTIAQINNAIKDNTIDTLPMQIHVPEIIPAKDHIVTQAELDMTPSDNYKTTILSTNSQQFINKDNLPCKMFRKIIARSTLGSTKRQITTIVALTPTFWSPNSSPDSAMKMFSGGLQANGTIKLTNVQVEVSNSADYGEFLLKSNTQISSKDQNLAIKGSVAAFASQTLPPDTQALDIQPTSKIFGNLTYNEPATPPPSPHFDPISDSTSQDTANVLGDGDAKTPNGQINPSINPIETFEAPTLTQNKTAKTTQNNISIDNVQPTDVANIGSLEIGTNASTPKTTTIEPGTYITNNFSVGSEGTLKLKNSDSGSVTLSIQDSITSGDQSGAINFEGKISGAESPQALQIYYNGNQPINISLQRQSDSFNALIFAPNAPVTVELYGKEFHGAIVSNTLDLYGYSKITPTGESGKFIFSRKDIENPDKNPSGMKRFPALQKRNTSDNLLQTNYRIISWHEQNQF
jgi:hypothetical protein